VTYLEYFELAQEPFSNAPVSRFYYNSAQHSQALTRLLHTVSYMKGLSVLIGDIGAGKTTLARRMLDSLPEDEYEAALLVIIHSGITANWLLKRIALQLGVENPAQEKLALLSQLYQRLLQIYDAGKKAVVLIDEAQMLETRELMEEFRGLLNLEVPERKLISFVFFGLPEIEKNLKLDPPLAQRVAMRYRLEPFTADSTEAYIKHRLRLAGCPRMPFTSQAIEALHRRSGGTPRVINTLCDNALFEAFLARTPDIGAPLVEQIADNLGLEIGGVGKAPLGPLVPSSMPAPTPTPVVGPPRAPPASAPLRPGAAPLAQVRPAHARPTPPMPAAIPEIAKPPVPSVAPVMAHAGPAHGPLVPVAPPPFIEEEVEIVTATHDLADVLQAEVVDGEGGEGNTEPGARDEPPSDDVSGDETASEHTVSDDGDEPLDLLAPPASNGQQARPLAPAAAPAPGAEKPGGAQGAPGKGRGVDLAEIDRYLEGLNKL
jgi:type II secretory pathway predicted ATPase ExeA